MKFLKTIILSIALAFAASKVRRGKAKCRSTVDCKKDEYCSNFGTNTNSRDGICELKQNAKTHCFHPIMCKSGNCKSRSCQ